MPDMKQMTHLALINEKRETVGALPLDIEFYTEAVAWEVEFDAGKLGPDGQPISAEETPSKAPDGSVVDANAQTEPEPTKVITQVAPSFSPPSAQESQAGSDDKEKIAELEKQVNDLNAYRGRASKKDTELKELKEQLAEANTRADLAERTAKNSASTDDILSKVSQERLDNTDRPTLELAMELNREMTEGQIEKMVAERLAGLGVGEAEINQKLEALQANDQQRSQVFAEEQKNRTFARVNKEIPPEVYSGFAGPKWNEWGGGSRYGFTKAELYKKAIEANDSNAIVSLFSEYMEFAGIEMPSKKVKPPLGAPQSTTNVTRLDPNAKKHYVYEDVEIMIRNKTQRRELPRGWSDADWDTWFDDVTNAPSEGRMKTRAGVACRTMPCG